MANATFNFGSMFGSSSGSSVEFNLSDYAAIKNGSYRKLVGAVYGNKSSASSAANSKANSYRFEVKNKADRYAVDEDKKTDGTDKTDGKENTEKKALTTVQKNATSMKESLDKLTQSGAGSIYDKVSKEQEDGSATMEYDTDAIYKAAQSFVNNYNATLTTGAQSTSTNVVRTTRAMTNYTEAYRNSLSAIGISIGSNNQLSIDAEKFKNADMETVKSIFSGKNSYGEQMSKQASLMNTYAKSAAAVTNTYSQSGKYNYFDYSSMFSSKI